MQMYLITEFKKMDFFLFEGLLFIIICNSQTGINNVSWLLGLLNGYRRFEKASCLSLRCQIIEEESS
jgi:hypothetical protein